MLINPHPNYNITTFLSKYDKCSYVDQCKTRVSRMLRFGRKIKHKSFQKAILKKPRSSDCHDQNSKSRPSKILIYSFKTKKITFS